MEARTRVRKLAPIVVGLIVAACASEAPTSDRSPSTPTTSPSPSRTFESSRHGYLVEVPPRWDVTEHPGTWTRLGQFSPGAEVPGEDVVAPPDLSSFLVSNSMEIPSGMTASEWLEAFDALVAAGLPAACPATTGSGTLAGERATVVEQSCEGSIIIGRSLTHAGRGYYLTVRFPADDAAARATVERLVRSIRFADD
jgi:hypothetical protein